MSFKILLSIDPALGQSRGGYARSIKAEASEVLRRIQAPGIVPVVSLLACSDRVIRKLNRRWLGKDRPTNVISFQSPEMSAAVKRLGPVPLRKGAIAGHLRGRRGEVFLGDIAVSVERAAAEAGRAGMDARERIARLVFHGIMHILGYTHRTMPDLCPAQKPASQRG